MDPSDLREQTTQIYEAFAKHEHKKSKDKIERLPMQQRRKWGSM